MSDRNEALRLASEVDRDTGCLPSVEIERNDQWIERFYQLCRDKFAEKSGVPKKVQRIVDAAKWCNWCPDAGGYKDGRSVEDCYEELDYALRDYFGVNLESPMTNWISEEELEAKLAPPAPVIDPGPTEGATPEVNDFLNAESHTFSELVDLAKTLQRQRNELRERFILTDDFIRRLGVYLPDAFMEELDQLLAGNAAIAKEGTKP